MNKKWWAWWYDNNDIENWKVHRQNLTHLHVRAHMSYRFHLFFFPSLWYWLIYWVFSIVHVAKSYRHVSRQYTWGQNPCLMSWPNLTTRVYVGPTPILTPRFGLLPPFVTVPNLDFSLSFLFYLRFSFLQKILGKR